MRKKEDIIKEYPISTPDVYYTYFEIMIELLLDIRELLRRNK
jgi:hypothetical protein